MNVAVNQKQDSISKRGDVFISQKRLLVTYLVLFGLCYVTLGWIISWPEPLWPALSEMLATDDTGIILIQIAAFFAFLGLAALQLGVSFGENSLFCEGQTPLFRHLFLPGGVPSDWSDKWKKVSADLATTDIVLGQHFESRMTLLRFLVAAFPTSGFIGTVIGIRKAIAPLDDLVESSTNMGGISSGLGDVVSGLEIAFDTTLVGLVFFLLSSLISVLVATHMRRVHAGMMSHDND